MIRAIEGLKKMAQSSTKYRGHSMRWGRVTYEQMGLWAIQEGVCRLCNMTVKLKNYPLPNETQIAGEAVALQCTKITSNIVKGVL